jgi:hypothetical protein
LFTAIIVAAAAIAIAIAPPETIDAILGDFFTWFRYFAGPVRRG